MKKQICFILLIVFALVACKQSSDLVHFIEIEDTQWQTEFIPAGKTIRMKVIAQTQNGAVATITTTAYDDQHGDYTILDSTFTHGEKSLEFFYAYTLPTFMDTTVVHVTSMMQTTSGEEWRYRFNLYVLPDNANMHTLDAVTMYSAKSGGKYGFSLATLQPIFPDTRLNIPDSLRTDSLVFFDRIQSDSTRADQISCEWESHTGVYFARFESFDYQEATVASIQRAYDICKHDKIIQNIQNDDVILFGTQTDALGALKVLFVADEPGCENDRYIFSMKTFLQ